MGSRSETDSQGSIDVPEDAYWGAQTQRCLEHFAIGSERLPTAMHVATTLELRDHLAPAIDALLETLDRKSCANRDVIKIGRTHLQDAVPMTLGQEIGGWAARSPIGSRARPACPS